MKIGFFGHGPWAEKALKLLQEKNVEISYIVTRYQNTPVVHCSLQTIAEKINADFFCFKHINDVEVVAQLKDYNVDLMVSMSFDQIIKYELIQLSPLGFINCHAGALPFYRGRNPLNWALINGESEFGISVHYVDEGIDTGDIILQKMYAIDSSDHYAKLLDVAIDQCAVLLVSAIESVLGGTNNRIPQVSIHPVGFYCGRRREGDEKIIWPLTSMQLHNFIRALSHPGPCARCLDENRRVMAIQNSQIIADAPVYTATVGEVVGRDSRGVVVKTLDSSLRLTQVAWVENDEVGTSFVPQYPIGTRLMGF